VFDLVKVECYTSFGRKYLAKFTDVVLLQLPEGKKLDLLKNLAESSPFNSTQDARQLLPSILQLLKVMMPRLCKSGDKHIDFDDSLIYKVGSACSYML
jgi:hypothetical protein